MGNDGAYEVWLEKLALTPRFDEPAASAILGATTSAESIAAWKRLTSYSFLKPTIEAGWHTLHFKMREVLNKRTNQGSDWKAEQQRWQTHWESRITAVPEDQPHLLLEGSNANFSALAWFHAWNTDPAAARSHWNSLAETEHHACRMTNHFSLLSWWTPCRLETLIENDENRAEVAAAMNDLGIEWYKTSLGNRTDNLQQAIKC